MKNNCPIFLLVNRKAQKIFQLVPKISHQSADIGLSFYYPFNESAKGDSQSRNYWEVGVCDSFIKLSIFARNSDPITPSKEGMDVTVIARVPIYCQTSEVSCKFHGKIQNGKGFVAYLIDEVSLIQITVGLRKRNAYTTKYSNGLAST